MLLSFYEHILKVARFLGQRIKSEKYTTSTETKKDILTNVNDNGQ